MARVGVEGDSWEQKDVGKSVRLTGVGASEGTVVGPAFVHVAGGLKPERENISGDEIDTELERFQESRL